MASFEHEKAWAGRDAALAGTRPRYQMCEHYDRVCNEAVTLADECPEFLAELVALRQEEVLPRLSRFLPWLDVDETLSWIMDKLRGAYGYIR